LRFAHSIPESNCNPGARKDKGPSEIFTPYAPTEHTGRAAGDASHSAQKEFWISSGVHNQIPLRSSVARRRVALRIYVADFGGR
jgi:hypothetical protein